MGAARERHRLQQKDSLKYVDIQLAGMSRLTSIDFSKFDLDENLPMDPTTNGHQFSLAGSASLCARSCVVTPPGSLDYPETPEHVAGVMREVMEEVGRNGFLIFDTLIDRRGVIEVCDRLVPEQQRRGLTRKAYAHKHLHDDLPEF